MGDVNQLNFVKQNAQIIQGPILEVGSKNYGSTPNFRPLFPGCTYVGVDAEAGDGVDVVLDLTSDFPTIAGRLTPNKFNTVICFSVLEHCRDPFAMCRNLSALLNPGGLLFVSVPFSWKVHAYPSDYWRFTPEAVRVLFPGFDFDTHSGNLSTDIVGRTHAIDDFMMRIETSARKARQRKSCGPLAALGVELARKLRLLPHVFRHRYLLPPVMVNMIGAKK